MRETWYVLEDGSNADPREVAPDDKGVLRHKDGVAVAIGDHGNPRSRSIDVDEESPRATKPAKSKKDKPSPEDRQIKADETPDPKYQTR